MQNTINMEENKTTNITDFSGLKLLLASPEVITGWSYGEVLKPETINYRTFKPEKDGLFDERIFGPTKDYECYCGKYKRIRYKGIICDRCGVEITTNSVRRERMGHLKLASPIAHIWYFKGVSSPLRVLLDIPSNNLERIIYYALYLVKDINEEKRKKTLEGIKKIYEKELDVLDEKNKIETKRIKDEEQKEKNDIEVKVKNKERKELTINEIEFKYRERYVGLNKKYAEKKADTRVYYERIEKLVQTLSPLGVIEEEDYLFFKDKNLDNFMSVGMGSEVILEILNNLDINKLHSEAIKKLIKTKGNKRTQLVKKIRLIESFMKSGVSPKSMILVVLPVIPPDLRPVVQLSGGKFATSDLNDFYRRVINRHNRLK